MFSSSLAQTLAEEEIAILEANLDDLNPQLIGYIVDLALAEGALDVFTTPVQMKKNRPGTRAYDSGATGARGANCARCCFARAARWAFARAMRSAMRCRVITKAWSRHGARCE